MRSGCIWHQQHCAKSYDSACNLKKCVSPVLNNINSLYWYVCTANHILKRLFKKGISENPYISTLKTIISLGRKSNLFFCKRIGYFSAEIRTHF